MLAQGDRFALEFAAQAAEVADDVDCGLCLRACLGAKRVPGLERNRVRQLLDPCLKRISDPREKAPALARNRARPGGKGIGRGLHCARDVLSAPRGTSAIGRRCAGSSTSSTLPEALSTHFPPINMRDFLSATSSVRIFLRTVMTASVVPSAA